MTPLSSSTVTGLDRRIAVPHYDPADVRPSIAHLGVGGFHRAHQAVYLDDLLNSGRRDCGIVGIGLRPEDRAMRDALTAQDCLYTVVVKNPDGTVSPRVVGAIVRYLFAPDAPGEVLRVLTDPAIQIVTLTITEGGYYVDQASGDIVIDDDLRADLDPAAVPRTAVGFLVRALAARRATGTAPFTVVSCDNIPGNGALAQRTVAAAADVVDPDLAAWIRTEVPFPDSMVDRITPATSDADRARLAGKFGLTDRWPVVCEPYRQWVLEDHFASGRPPLEDVGAMVVADVRPYELMKLRLLNAGHQVIGFLGYLAGHRYAHQVAADPVFAELLRGYLEREATPTLGPLPGVDLDAYRRSLLARFGNRHVADTLARLCADSSNRIPTFVLPVIRQQLATGGELRRSALVVAAWARYATGVDEQGAPIDVVDGRSAELSAAARRFDDDPLGFLRAAGMDDLADRPAFTTPYVDALRSLHRHGAAATTARLLAELDPA